MQKAIFTGFLVLALSACSGGETDSTSTETPDPAATETVPTADGTEDVLVAGTDYNATTILNCGFDNAPPTQSCDAGVKRNWGDDGTTLVEVKKPDGFTRAIFFKGTEPYGADSAQADGSAGWDFKTTREGDQVTINFGPETYVIVDAFVEGG
ncbi:hypothetical protein [Altererythrobacter sp. Z27]|uniref:hypothetical protein n=1 Tax=Altererythrobacter sp. Z27 TaxID=3461147 RepID=UPI0040446598